MSDETSWRSEIEEALHVASEHGVNVDAGSTDRLLCYCRAVRDWNERAGLISPHDLPHLVKKHIAVSVAPLLVVQPGTHAKWIDVGTGGGLPGVVIKLCRPELAMTLLDSSRKKTIFLEHLQGELERQHGITNLMVLESRVEQVRSPGYEVILMRAVGALKKTLPLLDGISGPGVRLITYKGERLADELRDAEKTMHELRWSVESTRPIPWGRSTLLSLVRGGS